MAKVSFNNSNQVFFASLKKAVDTYFRSQQIKKTGNFQLYLKTTILIPTALILYISLLVFRMPAPGSLVLCALLGGVLASIGFNVMHDACHGSYSSKKWVNSLLGLTLNALGGNAFFWKQKHNILHHTYTNIAGVDDDIAQSKLLRQSPAQEWIPLHQYQHLYLPLAYSLTLFMWVGMRDFDKYFKKRIHNTPIQKMAIGEHIIFWLSKLLYIVFYIVVPVLCVGWLPWLIGYITMAMVMGLVLAFVFQLAHAVEGPEFDAIGLEDKVIESEWAIHQIRTTANFAPKSKLISWMAGGLNYQIEHHLFPRISHIHYPALSKIVQEHCRKFNLPYHCFLTTGHAVASHVRIMKQLGKKPVEL
ncbi:fatty acid desaturase family protein [Flavisolibacter tropicus]|uniref:Fatty acid desaturase n=1 Tax=Flavisolibacter tropicus TaxID=1492898 RepID=A0A172U1Q6_9BACT|nr:acyl-CoA desaturase [Flavisolibacter tropicus]ANE53054.1 fatty acid desaturase [Flavisolibacter tropicus]